MACLLEVVTIPYFIPDGAPHRGGLQQGGFSAPPPSPAGRSTASKTDDCRQLYIHFSMEHANSGHSHAKVQFKQYQLTLQSQFSLKDREQAPPPP